MDRFENVVNRLISSGIVGEIWVDGSFMTRKMNPQDLDVVLRMQAHLYDNGTPQQRAAVDWLGANLKATDRCDSYVLMEYPVGHPNYWVGEYMHAYWMRQWGFSRLDNMKGIAVVTLP